MPKRISALSVVSMLWLLNSALGARVAVKEGLPDEWVADLQRVSVWLTRIA